MDMKFNKCKTFIESFTKSIYISSAFYQFYNLVFIEIASELIRMTGCLASKIHDIARDMNYATYAYLVIIS